jgi:hypothetical protein
MCIPRRPTTRAPKLFGARSDQNTGDTVSAQVSAPKSQPPKSQPPKSQPPKFHPPSSPTGPGPRPPASSMICLMVRAQRPHCGEQPRQPYTSPVVRGRASTLKAVRTSASLSTLQEQTIMAARRPVRFVGRLSIPIYRMPGKGKTPNLYVFQYCARVPLTLASFKRRRFKQHHLERSRFLSSRTFGQPHPSSPLKQQRGSALPRCLQPPPQPAPCRRPRP